MSDEALMLEKFLENVRGTVPLGVNEIDSILRLIAAGTQTVQSYLDLDCGGGLVSAAVRQEHPGATAVLLPGTASRRYEQARWLEEAQAAAPYDLVTSGVDLPLLPEERQRPFYDEIYALLKPGGLFLTVEYVAWTTRYTQSPWDDRLIETLFGEVMAEEKKRSRVEVARAWYERLQVEHRVPPLELQCEWLRESGFENVECFLKISELAVFGGQRPL